MIKFLNIISILLLVPLLGILFTGHPSPLTILGFIPIIGILSLIAVWFRKSWGLVLYSLVSLFIFIYPVIFFTKQGEITLVNFFKVWPLYYLLFFPVSVLVFWLKHEPFTPFLPKLSRTSLWVTGIILVVLLTLFIDSYVIPGGFVDYILNLIIR